MYHAAPYTPGPGDLMGQYTGHPHDPRTPDELDEIQDAHAVLEEISLCIGMADRGIQRGDLLQFRAAMELAQTYLASMTFS